MCIVVYMMFVVAQIYGLGIDAFDIRSFFF